MQTDQKVHNLSLQVGPSTQLSTNNEITLRLNKPLVGADRVYLTAVGATNPATGNLRVEFLGTNVHPLDAYVATVDGGSPTSGVYLLVPAVAPSTVTQLATPQCVIYRENKHSQMELHSLRLRVTDWQGAAVTFDDLSIIMAFTLAPPEGSTLVGRVPGPNAVGPYRDVGRL